MKKFLYLRTLYWFNLTAGGSVGHTAGVINALNKKVDLKVVSNEKLAEVDCPIEIVKPILIPLIPKEFCELLYNVKIIRHCRQTSEDVIYQRYNGFSFCGAYLAKKKQIPFILEFNSSDVWKIKYWKSNDIGFKKLARGFYNKILKLPIVRLIEKYNIYNASLIVVVSKALKDYLINLGVRPEKVIVIPNAIDETKYHPDIDAKKIKDQYHLHHKVVLGFIGTFGQWHGAENIVLAYGKFLEEHPEYKKNTVLFMIGDGLRMGEVKKHINHFGISENVVLTGLVPQKAGANYMAACDILINATVPNPDGSEFFGSPTKLFEYMALGKAIICSNMAQMAEIIEHNVTGYLVEPGSIPSLAGAMEVLINNPGLREKLGKNARNKVVSKHTWGHNIDNILARLEVLPGYPFDSKKR